MYKILILAYLVGSDPVITQQNFEMQGWFKTMDECQTELLTQHPDQTYRVMREFVEDNNFKWDWLVAGCTNEETGEKYTQKGPINTANRSATVDRVENVFFNVIIFLFWVDIILFFILAIGTILHYIG